MTDQLDIHAAGPSMVAAAFANQLAYCRNNGAPIPARVVVALAAAGARATVDRPLAWVALEANRTVHHHELVVRYWNGGPHDGAAHKLAHAHGDWVEWLV